MSERYPWYVFVPTITTGTYITSTGTTYYVIFVLDCTYESCTSNIMYKTKKNPRRKQQAAGSRQQRR